MPFKIIEAETIAPNNRLLVVEAPLVAQKAKAGQFAILRVDETGERIPLTLADWDSQAGTVTFVVQEIGKTSARMARLKKGDFFRDVVGPLGNPTHIDKLGSVVTIGGGLGIAAIYPIARAFHEAGNNIISIVGARNKELLFWQEKMAKVSATLHLCTDDGSAGTKGFVSDLLKKIIETDKTPVNFVFAVGPTIMMKTVALVTKPHNINTWVSLNPIMVDGTGMCGACRVEVGGKTYFACVDGPDFDAHQVNFDLLMQRQRAFSTMEKESFEHYREKCRAEEKLEKETLNTI